MMVVNVVGMDEPIDVSSLAEPMIAMIVQDGQKVWALLGDDEVVLLDVEDPEAMRIAVEEMSFENARFDGREFSIDLLDSIGGQGFDAMLTAGGNTKVRDLSLWNHELNQVQAWSDVASFPKDLLGPLARVLVGLPMMTISAELLERIGIELLRATKLIPPLPKTWAFSNDGNGPPRRSWAAVGSPSLFFPPMNTRWLRNQLRVGVSRHGGDLGVGMPFEAFRASYEFNGPWRGAFGLLTRIKFRRTGRGQPAGCEEVLADGLREDIDNLPNRRSFARFVVAETYQVRGQEQREAYLAHQLVNGKFPMPLLKTDKADEYEVLHQYTDLPFGDSLGRKPNHYRLPDIRTRIKVQDGNPRLVSITTRYRNVVGYEAGGEDTYGAPFTVDMQPDASPAWLQERARRVLASSVLLTAQLDQHIARGHMVPEMYWVALNASGMSDKHPIYKLLAPRLSEVDIVNWNADAMIWGDYGLLSVGSAITAAGLQRRFRDRIGGMDWKGFVPRSQTICPGHYAPRVHTLYWRDAVLPYVEYALHHLGRSIDTWWTDRPPSKKSKLEREARGFFAMLTKAWPKRKAWDGLPRDAWLDASEFGQGEDGSAGCTEVITKDDVRDCLAFVVYQATMGHGWPNIRQMDAGGEPRWATFGLRRELSADGPPKPGKEDTWHAAADQDPTDCIYALAVGDVLSTLEVDTFDGELKSSTHADALSPGVPRDPFLANEHGLAKRWAALVPDIEAILNDDPFVGEAVKDHRSANPTFQLSRTNR